METRLPKRNAVATIIAILAIVHGVAGLLRAFQWFDAGGDLMGQGLFLLPLTGLVAIARGALISGIALAFIVLAGGLLLKQSWARWFGIVLGVINLLLVLSLLIQGESLIRAVPWVIVPAIILTQLTTIGAPHPAANR